MAVHLSLTAYPRRPGSRHPLHRPSSCSPCQCARCMPGWWCSTSRCTSPCTSTDTLTPARRARSLGSGCSGRSSSRLFSARCQPLDQNGLEIWTWYSYGHQGPGVAQGSLGLHLLHEGCLQFCGGSIGRCGGTGGGGRRATAEERHGW